MKKRKSFRMFKGICKICKKKKYLSRNHICQKCAMNRLNSANFQMKAKEGPIYDKWLEKMRKQFEEA